MTRVVPAETDLLCENCGYTLNGLPASSNCPECGWSIASSTTQDGRGLSGFEQRPGGSSFVATTLAVLLRPRKFFRGLATRQPHPAAQWFARRHRVIAAFAFTSAALGYALWIESMTRRPRITGDAFTGLSILYLTASIVLFYAMGGIMRLAVWLSSKEGAFWGMRLPPEAVRRCFYYHSACYLPIAVVANVLVWGYRWLIETGVLSRATGERFAYTLCIFVVLAGGYLFRIYMIAMRNTRYANR